MKQVPPLAGGFWGCEARHPPDDEPGGCLAVRVLLLLRRVLRLYADGGNRCPRREEQIMGRYRTTVLSSTAPGVDAAIAFLMSVAANGYTLTRVTASLQTTGSSSAPPDQNCVLGIAPATAGPTGAPTSLTVTKMKPIYPTNAAVAATTYATTNPTFGAATADAHRIDVSSRGGYEGIWEPAGGQDFDVNSGVANGLVFVNRANALTSPLAWLLSIEWAE